MQRFFPFLLLLLIACGGQPAVDATNIEKEKFMPTIVEEKFGQTPEGLATLYTLLNEKGNTVKITNFGGIITSIVVDGIEVVIGFDDLKSYLEPNPYYGALIGRYGNRIANASFNIDGESYSLAANNGDNNLHGGIKGFDKHLWQAKTAVNDQSVSLTLSRLSPDGEEGFPGNLTVSCRYEWTNDNELKLTYQATTDKPTIVNLTNHTYFNLAGEGTILNHKLTIKADRFTPVNENMVPTGEEALVVGTPFDFREAKSVGQDIKKDNAQLAIPNGYDHNFVLNSYDGNLREFATVTAGGRTMRCFTTEPGVQLWTSNFKPGLFPGRDGSPLPVHGALCLETQHFPDAPNQPNFKTPLLRQGETYRTETVYRFE